jgi:uncharacterized membrane protein
MKGLRTALFVSLAVNLLLVGVIGGAALSNARHERAAAHKAVERAPNMRAILSVLPAERQRDVRIALVRAWRESRDERVAARQARAEAFRAAAADSYDSAAVKAAFARQRAADQALAAKFHDAVIDAIAGFTAEERRAVLRELARRRIGAQLRQQSLQQQGDEPAEPAP